MDKKHSQEIKKRRIAIIGEVNIKNKMTHPLTFKPPKGMRGGQALYNFLFWLQDRKQLDTFYMSNEVIMDFYKEWLNKLKK